jgi:molybdopterin synthase sulfur carrier subunit
MPVKILYFSWVREKTGTAEEIVELPAGIETVAGLIGWLKTRGPHYAAAFADARVIRAAINRRHVTPDVGLEGAHEIAFFPPVTGG